MHFSTLPLLYLLATNVAGSPFQPGDALAISPRAAAQPQKATYDWSAKGTKDFPIHKSCNAASRAQLKKGLDDTVKLAQHAKEHLLRWGHDSKFVTKYFGSGTTATPIGWYDRIISADRTGMLFRCDDPDGKCVSQKGWAGHWRSDKAVQETVICPLSFKSRKYLDATCKAGYTVAGSNGLKEYWGVDLMHRVLHVPKISEGVVDHHAEDYNEVIELAAHDPATSAVDSNALQYFAIDVYAYDIALPGVGCTDKKSDKKPVKKPAKRDIDHSFLDTNQ